MRLLDFFFPEEAQAAHLRTLAEAGQQQAVALRAQQYAEEQQRRQAVRLNSKAEDRVAELESELAQSVLVIEALISLLEEKTLLTREELRQRAEQIDSADGVADGRITPDNRKPFAPKRSWPG